MGQVTKNLQDGELVVNDNVAETITVALDVGDLRFTEHRAVKQIDDRETLSHMRKGPEAPVDVSVSAKFVEMIKQTGASDPTLREALLGIGAAAAWVSTGGDSCDVHCVELVFTIVSCTTGEDYETITFAKFHAETVEFSEGSDYNVISVSGIDYETSPSVAKTAAP